MHGTLQLQFSSLIPGMNELRFLVRVRNTVIRETTRYLDLQLNFKKCESHEF